MVPEPPADLGLLARALEPVLHDLEPGLAHRQRYHPRHDPDDDQRADEGRDPARLRAQCAGLSTHGVLSSEVGGQDFLSETTGIVEIEHVRGWGLIRTPRRQ